MHASQPTSKNVAQTSSVTESRAIYSALATGAVGFVIALLCFNAGDVALFTRGLSLGVVASIVGGVSTCIVYLLSAYAKERQTRGDKGFSLQTHINIISLALVHTFLIFLVSVILFFTISNSFIGVSIDRWSAAAIVALSSGFCAYVVYLSAVNVTTLRISVLLAAFLVSGVFLSMLTASNEHWWDDHFSSLGAGGGVSGYAFNATLIIAGVVIVALSTYIAQDFQQLQKQNLISQKTKVRILQWTLAGIGIALALVGLFVYDAFPLIHNTAAEAMAVLFIGLIIALPWLTPGFTKAFFLASYCLLAGLLLSVWLFVSVGYLNLTVFELLAAALIFVWLILFVRSIAALLEDGALTK